MHRQTANTVVMVKPERFGFNTETTDTNFFQKKSNENSDDITLRANLEFEKMVRELENKGIQVITLSFGEEDLPDAVFPNNWFVTFENGDLILFPMYSPKRRRERKTEILLKKLSQFRINRIYDFTRYESDGFFLEGTGSVVLDRINKSAYACESSRTSRVLFDVFCSTIGISVNNRFFFRAYDNNGREIYHTNVIMSLGENFCVICEECIHQKDRERIMNSLAETGRNILSINKTQMHNFCANILQLENNRHEKFILMSSNAQNTFKPDQMDLLKKHGEIISAEVNTIEKVGGGSVRCMLAEIFLPSLSNKKNNG
ncbi:MAG: arginine deiminase-related protein [Ignavibacteria bacterium]|nr:arginine deiminase-related protein [Ignavibacteria bacterium]